MTYLWPVTNLHHGACGLRGFGEAPLLDLQHSSEYLRFNNVLARVIKDDMIEDIKIKIK